MRTFAACTAGCPTQYHFPQQITVCKIVCVKGTYVPQWALANNTFPCFSPPQAHPLPPPKNNIKDSVLCHKKWTTENHPETTIHFLLWEQCLLHCPSESQKFRNREHQNIFGKNVCSGYVSKAQILLLLLSSCVTLSKLLNLSAFDSLILKQLKLPSFHSWKDWV